MPEPRLPRGRTGRKNKRDPFRPSGRARVKITPDDVALLRFVEAHRLIDSRQLDIAMRGGRNQRYFLQRLDDLSDTEYLDRPPAQKRPGQPSRHMIYALGVRGRQLLDGLDQVDRPGKRDWRLENDRLKLEFLQHELAVTEAVLALHIAAEAYGWQFRWWIDPRYHADGTLPSRVLVGPGYGRQSSLPLKPDAYIEITRDDGHRLNFFLEIDRGTEPQVQTNFARAGIAQKMAAYWQFITDVTRRQATREQTWRALFITTTAQRAANMRAVAQGHVDPKRKGTHLFLVTTLEQACIDPEQPLRPFEDSLWWSTKIGYENPRQLLLFDECPKCHQLVDRANEPYELVESGDAEESPSAPIYAHLECPGRRGSGAPLAQGRS